MGPWKGIKAGKILPNISKFYRKKRRKTKSKKENKTAKGANDITVRIDDSFDSDVEIMERPARSAILVDFTSH